MMTKNLNDYKKEDSVETRVTFQKFYLKESKRVNCSIFSRSDHLSNAK